MKAVTTNVTVCLWMILHHVFAKLTFMFITKNHFIWFCLIVYVLCIWSWFLNIFQIDNFLLKNFNCFILPSLQFHSQEHHSISSLEKKTEKLTTGKIYWKRLRIQFVTKGELVQLQIKKALWRENDKEIREEMDKSEKPEK